MVQVVKKKPQKKKAPAKKTKAKKKTGRVHGLAAGKLPKKGSPNSSVKYSALGVPSAEPVLNAASLPSNLPETDGKYHLEQEAEIYQVETLMNRGTKVVSHIAQEMDIPISRAATYVERVKYRQTLASDPRKMRELKGAAQSKLDLINRKIWEMFDGTKSAVVRGACLREAREIFDRECMLNGINAKSMEDLRTDAQAAPEGISVAERIMDHTRQIEIAKKLEQYLDSQPVEGEFEEVADG